MTATTEQTIAETVKSAKHPLRITGGGTRDIGHPVVGDVLDVSGLSGITLYEPGALTVVARTGTPVAEIEAALDAENQRLAFEPMDHRALLGTTGTPTIGGIVAGNVSGSRRISVGACRDHMLGVRFVDGSGTIIKNGGRVMKNVTGYDLVKLLTGAYGTLGVLTEVSLKVLPKPETSATLALHRLSIANSVAAMSEALGSPYEITGAAYMGDTTYLRIEGFETSVAYRLTQLQNTLSRFGEQTCLDHGASVELWRDITNVTAFKDHATVSRVSVPPSEAPDLAERHAATYGAEVMLDWGGGLMWFGKSDDQNANGNAGIHHKALQDACIPSGGHATLIKAPAETRRGTPVFQPEDPTVAMLTQGLRTKFDPRRILNSGLMG